MTSLFQENFHTYIKPSFQRLFGLSITYSRGCDSVALSEVLSYETSDEETTSNAVSYKTNHTAFEIDPELLILDAMKTKPQRGDRITYVDANIVTHTYEVSPKAAPTGGRQPVWVWDERNYRIIVYCHTILEE